jgi:transposase
MSPEYVRPYVKSQKNDDRDAEAIAEAATRPTMRFVASAARSGWMTREPWCCGDAVVHLWTAPRHF